MTSRILFLGTELEASRIEEPRLTKIFEEMNRREEKREENFLAPDLLDSKDDM
jgi:hypothetical protein